MILMETLFSSITLLWLQTLELSLSNPIGLLLSIKIDRSHLDAHPTPTVNQLSPTSTIRAHWDHVYVSAKLQQSHCEQSYHRRSKNHSQNYSIETITDDQVEMQVISHMIILGTSCSLTTIRTHCSIFLHCRLETHLSRRKRSVRWSIRIDHCPYDNIMTRSI